MSGALRVVYVGSWSRSGSTLLDLLLGQVPGFVSAGELRLLWQRGLAEDQLCGCGERFAACGFWERVVEAAFGGRAGLDLGEVRALQAAVDRPACVPRLLAPGRGAFAASLERYRAVLARLYAALRDVAAARCVVDSSKAASHALVLAGIPGLELDVVHLVRDSRAVAHSWQRRKRMPEVHWQERYMPVFPPARSALFWSLENLALHTLRRAARRYVLLRYEDLARDPRGALSRLLGRLEEDRAALPFEGNRVELGVNHTVAGNPLRFERGTVEVRTDAAWRSGMRPAHKALVTALTWPLLARYGYLPAP